MKPSLLIEAQALIAKLPKGGKKDLADRLGWYPERVAKLAKGEEPRCAGGWRAREQMTQIAVLELRKMTSNAEMCGVRSTSE